MSVSSGDRSDLTEEQADADLTLTAAWVRAHIDGLFTHRAPDQRDAFWRAVARLYRRNGQRDSEGETGADQTGPSQTR